LTLFAILRDFGGIFGFLVVFRSFYYDFQFPGFLGDFHDPVSLEIKNEMEMSCGSRILTQMIRKMSCGWQDFDLKDKGK
jgi:hypothetical protein